MSKRRYTLNDVVTVTFKRHYIADDAERVIFEVTDAAGTVANIALNWLHLGTVSQMLNCAAEELAEARSKAGKSVDLDLCPKLIAHLVAGFQVAEYPHHNMKLLILHSPTGLRCDFAIPTDATDERGRGFPQAIAEELQADHSTTGLRPN